MNPSYGSWLDNTSGVPQGSVPDPILLNICIYDLIYFIKELEIYVYVYEFKIMIKTTLGNWCESYFTH